MTVTMFICILHKGLMFLNAEVEMLHNTNPMWVLRRYERTHDIIVGYCRLSSDGSCMDKFLFDQLPKVFQNDGKV